MWTKCPTNLGKAKLYLFLGKTFSIVFAFRWSDGKGICYDNYYLPQEACLFVCLSFLFVYVFVDHLLEACRTMEYYIFLLKCQKKTACHRLSLKAGKEFGD